MTHRGPYTAFFAALLFAGCAARETAQPVFALDQCTRVSLVDEASGALIIGAEDLDIDRKAGRIFVSAYDRRKAERAADERAASIPEGGVYAFDVAALNSGENALNVRPLVDPASIEGGLRPHGMSYDASNRVLTFINRAYERSGAAWKMEPRLVAVDLAGGSTTEEANVECSANDVASSGGHLVMTLDHGGCGWRMVIEDIIGARAGRLVDDKGEALLSGLGFANGVVAMAEGSLAVAATRDRAVHLLSASDSPAEIVSTVDLGAAPDNLSLADDGRVVAAVHPSLLSLGLQRKLGIGRSPSRIVELDLQGVGQRPLFDDPRAALVSAATVAIFTQETLIIGSVIDPGLVVCRNSANAP